MSETIDLDPCQVDPGGSLAKDTARSCYVNQTQPELSHNRDVEKAAVRAGVYEGVARDAAGP